MMTASRGIPLYIHVNWVRKLKQSIDELIYQLEEVYIMNRNIWLIGLGVVAVVLVCGAAAAALGVTVYSSLRDDPVSALAASLSRIENHEGT